MPAVSTRANYKSEISHDKAETLPSMARLADFAEVEAFLLRMARAIRMFHTYPATSQLCADAITAAHKALAAVDRRERLLLRVTPTELILDETCFGPGTIVELELVRRLHRAHIAALDVSRNASPRHLSRFCASLNQCSTFTKSTSTLAELLSEHGVDTIIPLMAHQPEILDVGSPPVAIRDLVEHEQRRRQPTLAAGGPVDYLYPPDKGWVRLDPGAHLEHVSLVDLAVLVDNPVDLAGILLRLTDDDPSENQHETALERKFSDVTTLFSALDPRLARVMFEKLSRAVLDLEPDRRQDLLRRTILPGLLDGHANGSVLRDFPDADLADSLCILLELEAAAPEVLSAAIDKLDLPAERRDAVLPLIDARLRGDAPSDVPDPQAKEREIDRFARKLVRVEATGKDFSDFSAFDLSLDEQTAATIAAVQDTIDKTDLPAAQLGCLSSLVRLESSTTIVDALLGRTLLLFGELERRGQMNDVATWAAHCRQLAVELREARPDVADAISNALVAFLVPARVSALLDLHKRGGESRGTSSALVEAFGGAVVPGLVALLDDTTRQSQAAAAVSLLCEHAGLLAPALVPELDKGSAAKKRAVIKALGCAGAGYEAVLTPYLGQPDEQMYREALRALVRTGTTRAAASVARELEAENSGRRAAAEEALWGFPTARAIGQVRRLLENHDFVVRHPQTALRMLDRATRAGAQGLTEVLAGLEHLKFRFWSRDVVKVAQKARELRVR
jgi:hypothetical protein